MKVFGKIETVPFQFNPAQLPYGRAQEYVKQGILGMDTQPLDSVGGSGLRSEIELLFDQAKLAAGQQLGAGPQQTIRDFLETLEGYAQKDPETDAPPILTFQYSERIFACVITEWLETSIDRDKNAVITRATVRLVLEEWVEEEYTRTTREEKGEQIYEVAYANHPNAGETFRNIANRKEVFDNPDLADAIKDYNPEIMLQCFGPIIPAGAIVIIPPWSFAKTYLNVETTGLVEFNR